MKSDKKEIAHLLCVLMNFPVAFFQFIGPLLLIISKVFNFGLVRVVPVDDITVCGSFIIDNGSTLHILIIIVHIDISLRISYSRRFHVAVHLTSSEKLLKILTGDYSILKCFVHTLSLNKS